MSHLAGFSPPWQRLPGLLAWPQAWQRPARTEEWAFEAGSAGLGDCKFSQLVCFPWASLIDLLDRGKFDRSRPFLDALTHAAPRSSLIRATVCQHIRIAPVLPYLKALQITDVFWSHARSDQRQVDGIRIHPFPLYPVRVMETSGPISAAERPSAQRRFLYSFIGAYSSAGYLTSARRSIADLPRRSDAYVTLRGMWHYELDVYGEQVAQRPTPPEMRARLARESSEYDEVLLDSVFSLCPSGSGPNSIRLWESLGFGCIPVLLSDYLRLPGTIEEWDAAIVRVPESREAIEAMPALLESIARDPNRLHQMQQAGRRLWSRYGEQGPSTVLGGLADAAWVHDQLAADRRA